MASYFSQPRLAYSVRLVQSITVSQIPSVESVELVQSVTVGSPQSDQFQLDQLSQFSSVQFSRLYQDTRIQRVVLILA
jgi:hypothetical protein